MPLPRATVLVPVAVLAVLAGRFLADRTGSPAVTRTPSGAVIAQTRADTLASVAKLIYFQEVYGAPNSSAFRLIGALPGLIAGLETGDLERVRRLLNHVTVRHAVHERVVRGGRILVDVGLKFVIAGQPHPLHAPDGTYLGRIEISIQDVIGYIKLVHRLTGAELVVHGRVGHAKASLSALQRPALPAAGPVSVAGHAYFVSSFARAGFGGEPLRVWILDRVR